MSRRSREKRNDAARKQSPPGSGPGGSEGSPWASAGMIGVALAAITFLLYARTLWFDFVNYDDPMFVTENRHMAGGFSWANIVWAFTTADAYLWHPLTWFTHLLDYQLYGLKAGGHHLTNILWHTATTVLLFHTLRRLTGGLWQSAAVAALFAWHPMHVQSVAWIAERKDVVSGFFWVLTMWGYCRYVEKPGAARYLRVMCFFALGLMAKPMVVTLPCVLLLLDVWPLRRMSFVAPGNGGGFQVPWKTAGKLFMEKVPMFALVAAVSVLTVKLMRSTGVLMSTEQLPVGQRVINAVVAYAQYLFKAVWPLDLSVFYPLPASWPAWLTGLSAVTVIAVTVVMVRGWREQGWLAAGWFWFLGTLFPTIGLVQNGGQSMADRYTYIPYIGLFIAAAWSAVRLAERRPAWRPKLAIGGGIVLGMCVVLTGAELGHWRNSVTLFTRAIQSTKNNYVAHDNLAIALEKEGRIPEAMEQYRAALKAYPGMAEAGVNLASLLFIQGKVPEAISVYRDLLKHRPKYAKALIGLAMALDSTGQGAEALELLQQAVKQKPDDVSAHTGLGLVYSTQGRQTEAEAAFRQALKLQPDMPDALSGLGNSLVNQGKSAEAVAPLQEALRIMPTHADAQSALGVAYAQMGQLKEAETELRKSLKLADTASTRNNLANVLVLLKRPHEAITEFGAALQGNPNWPNVLNSLAWLVATNPDATVRDGGSAVKLAERAATLTEFKDVTVLNTLAAAYAEAGRMSDAVTTAQKALQMATEAGQAQAATAIKTCLDGYLRNEPYRSAP